MPLNSSDEEDARFEDAERKYGRLCVVCYTRLDETDEDQVYAGRCEDHLRTY